MQQWLKKLAGRLRQGQAGCTLVELLVVVSIVVALAAVIIPNVAQFAGKGDEGAKAAEQENVQTAFDTYMADQGVTTVAANANPNNATNDFSATGVVDLSSYLRKDTTKYYYCWNSAGLITKQDVAANPC